ncbi:hypothetical protein [uncultured Clostridium sp.]|mgnify:CR=1 FL=1|uniref:hypothetical protein n=1 Tax=uncultured Clostridium sp. TaxID=59620 RepID=UPI0026038E5E|nr:hypothetical protein [uncultured Clostridium sp.]
MKIKIKTSEINFDSDLLNIQNEGYGGENLIKFIKDLIDNITTNSLKLKSNAEV